MRVDRPWVRLAWTLPMALVVTALALTGFLDVLTQGASPPPASKPVAMQIIELPPQPSQPQPAPAIETPPPAEATEVPPPVSAPPTPTTPMTPTTKTLPPPPPVPARKPQPTQPPHRRDLSRQRPRDQTAAPAQVPTSAPVTQSPPGGMTMGVRALYQPMPDIPEELRHRELAVVAMARFHVAADGSATVTLLQATADPRLNAALMFALRKWRFFPAMDNGQPVASTIDIRVPIDVH